MRSPLSNNSRINETDFWHDAKTIMPYIAGGEDHIQLLYRSKPDGKRIGIINATKEMLASASKWLHVCNVFNIDNWAYTDSLVDAD